MPTTYEDIIINAHGYSSKNRADKIATASGELLALVHRAVRGLYMAAARINPEYWGAVEDVAYNGGVSGWVRPTNALSVFHITEGIGGQLVQVVPLTDLTAETAAPSVYLLGRVYRVAASDAGPSTSATLAMYYTRLPAVPTAITDEIDEMWEQSFDNFLSIESAIYLALKDGRLDEAAALQTERAKEAQLFIEFLEVATPSTVHRFGQPRRAALPSILPLLAGGSS